MKLLLNLENIQAMNIKTRKILAVLLGACPFFIFVIFEKLYCYDQITVSDILGRYFAIGLFNFAFLLILTRYFLQENIKDYIHFKEPILLDVSLTFFLLISTYLIYSIGNITYVYWFNHEADRITLINVLLEIFNNPYYSIFYFGPFIWVIQINLEYARVFLLKNLWDCYHNRFWEWIIMVTSAGFIGLMNLDNGPAGIITGILIALTFNIVYYRYRSLVPLVASSILIQTIILVEFYFQAS